MTDYEKCQGCVNDEFRDDQDWKKKFYHVRCHGCYNLPFKKLVGPKTDENGEKK